jgi:hypothetical protein
MEVNDILKDASSLIIQAERETVWYQNDIGACLILYGFFEFRVKAEAKGNYSMALTGVSKMNILKYVRGKGYRKRYLPDSRAYLMVQVLDSIMDPVTPDTIRVDTYQEMLRCEGIEIILPSGHTFNFTQDLLHTTYLKNQDQIFNKNFLELMEEYTVPELRDERTISYFLFSNCIVQVSTENARTIPYARLGELNRCVWKSHIKNRDYNYNPDLPTSEFEKFIGNVAGHNTARINAFKSGIGYLLHRYNGSHMGQAVVCYDEKPTDVRNPQGGTGKGLMANGISQVRETAKIDGKLLKADDKFKYQNVKVTSQVVIIDDMHKDISFDIFFSCLTEGWTIEKKNMDAIKLEAEDSPKMLFSMNTIIGGNGTSHKRRMFVLEFADHYSKQITTGHEHPIEDEHGILFDRLVWTNNDWDSFTTYMIGCLSYYLKNGLQPYELINVGTNTLIQTTTEDFAEWVQEQDFQLNTYYKTRELFTDFKKRYYGDDADYKQRTFTNNIHKYASINQWDFKIITDNATKLSEFIFKEKS